MRFAHVLLVSGCLAIAPSVAAQQMWTVPGIVRAGGQNGTRFVSDLVLSNPGGSPALVVLQFVPGSQAPVPYDLDTGASLTLTDVVKSVFGLDTAVGAVAVTSDQPLLIRGRTYNTASAGTFGVAVPVVPDDRILQEGETADSLWIQQDASLATGYRTNVAVVFPDAGGGAATVTLFDSGGNPTGQKDFSLDAPGLQQLAVGGFATGPLPVGRARIQVTRGRAIGYCVVVDNVTGDGSLFPFETLPAGIQDVVLNGVVRSGGAGGTFWRSDARLFNPGPNDAAVTVSFHAVGYSNPSPITVGVTVPSGQILDLPDVLGTLMGQPVGSSGALRFRSGSAVAVLCRTSNLDPTGARPGTFGAQQRAVPLLSYLTSADAGALIPGIRQGGAFRTNVGFAAGADGSAYGLTLLGPAGEVLSMSAGTLGAFGWTQPNVGGLFPVPIPNGAQIVVNVRSGSLDVFDSSIDNGSGDPVVTAVSPLPQEIPAAATIGPAGGAIRSPDGRLTLKIPAGALSTPIACSIDLAPAGAATVPNGTDGGYILSLGDAVLAKDAFLVLSYGPEEAIGVQWLGLARQNGVDWYCMPGGSLDVAARTLTVPLRQTQLAAAAARRKSAGVRRTTFSAFEAWKITPQIEAVVENFGKGADFTLSYAGLGSAQLDPLSPERLIQRLAVSKAVWSVNRVDGGSAEAGFISEARSINAEDQSVHYQPPLCASLPNPLVISALVGPPFSTSVYASVEVVRRYWEVKVSWSLEASCPAPLTQTFAWIVGNTMKAHIHVKDDLTVVDDTPPPKGSNHTTVQPIYCGDSKGCGPTSGHIEDYPEGSISVTGAYVKAHRQLELHIGYTAPGFPKITYSGQPASCPPTTPDHQLGFGQVFQDWSTSSWESFTYRAINSHYGGGGGLSGGNDKLFDIEVALKPVKPPSCN